MYSKTWNCEVDDWAKWAVCFKGNPPDPQSWYVDREDAEAELACFDEEDREYLEILPVE